MAKISQSQLRTILFISVFLIGSLVQFAQSGQVLGVSFVRPFAIQASPSLAATPAPTPLSSPPQDSSLYPVASITDGDTFKVLINGTKTTVRIVGIDTPETVDPRRPVQCFGQEASTKLKELLIGQNVRLESDATQQNTDRYGRLLRFVFLENGTDVGKTMIEHGFAQESLYSKIPHKYRDAYVTAQADAQTAKRGLWADDACKIAE